MYISVKCVSFLLIYLEWIVQTCIKLCVMKLLFNIFTVITLLLLLSMTVIQYWFIYCWADPMIRTLLWWKAREKSRKPNCAVHQSELEAKTSIYVTSGKRWKTFSSHITMGLRFVCDWLRTSHLGSYWFRTSSISQYNASLVSRTHSLPKM